MAEPTTEACGCCVEEPKSLDDRVAELTARRDAVDDRLRAIDHDRLVGAR